MQLVREMAALTGLAQGLQGRAAPAPPAADVLEVGSKTIPTPWPRSMSSDNVSHDDAALQNALILAWVLLLQRERGEDDRVEQFSWGRRTSGGVEVATRVYLSKLDMDLGIAKSEPVSTFLEAFDKQTQGQAVSTSSDTIFFNEGKSDAAPAQESAVC